MLTAKEVRTCEFDMHRLFEEGYDTDQVDDILDQCADTIEILYHLLCQSHDRIDELEQEIAHLTAAKRNVYSKHRSRRRRK